VTIAAITINTIAIDTSIKNSAFDYFARIACGFDLSFLAALVRKRLKCYNNYRLYEKLTHFNGIFK